jgi:hypothetical protein
MSAATGINRLFWPKGAGISKSQIASEYSNALSEEGFSPKIDNEKNIVFKADGGTFIIFPPDSDADYFRIVFPNFWKVEKSKENERMRSVQG